MHLCKHMSTEGFISSSMFSSEEKERSNQNLKQLYEILYEKGHSL